MLEWTYRHYPLLKQNTHLYMQMVHCACGKYASFGFPHGKRICCGTCKTPDMIDVAVKRCPCGKRPFFGVMGKKATHCAKCKEAGMIVVVSSRCQCGKNPYFGFPGEKASRCMGCKEDGMTNVVSKKCPCGKQPTFGVPGERPTSCMRCKKDDMIDVISKKCPCGKQPTFGVHGQQPTCCIKCKTSEMEDVISKKCSGYNDTPCPTSCQLSPGHNYCLACDPDESRRLSRKRDEAAFFNFLNKHITITQQSYPVHFRCIDTNKMRAEIDGIIITKDVVVCLELDEDAHEYYDKGCEEARMHNVSAELKIAYPDHNIAWVRVNPHTKKNGKRDKSSRALKIRNQRHQEALCIIEDILQNPRDCIEYIGYL